MLFVVVLVETTPTRAWNERSSVLSRVHSMVQKIAFDFDSARDKGSHTKMPGADNMLQEEDLQIEISANEPADLFAVMVTRANSRVESVVCIPNHRGRPVLRKANGLRPDPERFKSPIKDGRRSALGQDRLLREANLAACSGVRFIPDHTEEDDSSSRSGSSTNKKQPHSGQRFHLRIAYPNGFTNKRRMVKLDGTENLPLTN